MLRNSLERPLGQPIASSSIPLLQNHVQHTVGRNQFIRHLSDEIAYNLYYFILERFGKVTKEELIHPSIDFITSIYESMV